MAAGSDRTGKAYNAATLTFLDGEPLSGLHGGTPRQAARRPGIGSPDPPPVPPGTASGRQFAVIGSPDSWQD
jgi:hypothetical protein